MERLIEFIEDVATHFRLARTVLLTVTALAISAYFFEAVDVRIILAGWAILCVAALMQTDNREKILTENIPISPVLKKGIDFGDMPRFLDEVDLGIYLLSADGSVLFQNRAAASTFGEFPVGSHISARMRAPGVLDIVRDTLSSKRTNKIEYSERLPSESVYLVRSAPVALSAHADQDPIFMLVFRDVSEARRIDRMRSDFIANASHELRTPLASLRGYIETLQGPAKGDAKAQERFLPIMLDQATRMSRLVDDLLSLSRLEVRAHLPPDQIVALGPLLEHVRDSLMPMATDLGVTINLDLPDRPVDVYGDHDELVEVFENLMENACKYGSEGEQVHVVLKSAAAGEAEIAVIDRGPGIPAEHVPRLTERFYRISVADSRSKKGTGLGLAIVKHILTRHRARLIVKSDVGEGATFTVVF